MGSKSKPVFSRIKRYFKEDVKEILFPSSLPNPPGVPPTRWLTFNEFFYVLRESMKDYADSWKKAPSRPANAEMDNFQGSEERREKQMPEGPTLVEELAEAARGGADKLKPALQKIYYSRVQIFRDTAMGFVEGYKEGLREVTSPQATDQQPPGPPGTDHAPTHPQDSFTGNSPQEEVLDPVPTKLPSTTPPAQTPQPKPDQDEVKTT